MRVLLPHAESVIASLALELFVGWHFYIKYHNVFCVPCSFYARKQLLL